MEKRVFKNYNSTCKGSFFSYTASHFFDVAAGYVCKIFLVYLKNLLFSVRKTIFKHALYWLIILFFGHILTLFLTHNCLINVGDTKLVSY